MEQIKNYIFSVMIVSAAAGIADIITPEGERGGLKKHVRLLISLTALAVLLAPLAKAFSFIAEFEDYRDFFANAAAPARMNPASDQFAAHAEGTKQWILGRGEGELSSGIVILLGDKFGIPPGEARVHPELEHTGEGIIVKKILIVLEGSSVWKNPYEIEEYISAALGCPCEVLA